MTDSDTKTLHFGHSAGAGPLLIAGPCVIESEDLCLEIAARLAELSSSLALEIVFKASFDKANRTAAASFRGPGADDGLRILQKVKEETGLLLLTDIHEPRQAAEAAQVVDIVQIPAFLCRQTDLLSAAGETGKLVNVKKGQFMAPEDMRYAVEKVNGPCWITERGTFFGYRRLVVDFAAAKVLQDIGCPLVFDATHSVQSPGGGQGRSAGDRSMAIPLARAALAVGYDGLFFEVHPDPDHALSDAANSISLDDFEHHLPRLVELHQTIRSWEQPRGDAGGRASTER